jgi:hypothetical protein
MLSVNQGDEQKIVQKLHECLFLSLEESRWALSIVLRNLPIQNLNPPVTESNEGGYPA